MSFPKITLGNGPLTMNTNEILTLLRGYFYDFQEGLETYYGDFFNKDRPPIYEINEALIFEHDYLLKILPLMIKLGETKLWEGLAGYHYWTKPVYKNYYLDLKGKHSLSYYLLYRNNDTFTLDIRGYPKPIPKESFFKDVYEYYIYYDRREMSSRLKRESMFSLGYALTQTLYSQIRNTK